MLVETIAARNTNSRHIELAAVFVAYFSSFFVLNSINTALPRIAADLDGIPKYSWAVSIPALASAFITLIFGKLSDMYGRRIILLFSIGFMLLGAILCAVSQSFVMLVITLSILSMGQGSIPPLCFSVLGDMYPPIERGKWAGLLNIASAITAFSVPTLSGWLVDTLSWRYIFWMDVPLAIITGIIVMRGLPFLAQHRAHKIDIMGSFYLAVASSTMILGISWLGNLYAWNSPQIISLLGISIVFWSLFLRTESKAHEPMLDITVLTNRTFLIASLSSLISLVGITAIMAYFPLFLQGVQGVNATLSGNIITPLSLLMSLMGIPAGLLIAKTKRYKWMYVAGYAILTIAMFSMLALKADTAVGWGFVITTVAGIGLGTIPTINALVVQYAVPKRLLGVATGGLYFFVMMGRAIAPAILGSAMNTSYTSSLAAQLPKSLNQFLDEAALSSLSNPRVLLSETAMSDLKVIFSGLGDQASGLFAQTVQAIRSALEAGLHTLFWIGAITMLLSFLLILAIPEISLDGETQQ
jgi:MFS family permease